ncbi:MAG: hypothetical protein HGA47_07465, partial [Zoogloea sp.]|nr:hypothetical protein [Zoogloea sp.]
WFAMTEIRVQGTPEYWRRVGVVVRRPEALQERFEVIGRFQDHEIYAAVRFQNRIYKFERVAPATYKSFMRGGELFLEPGLLYVMDGPDLPISARSG